MSEVYYEMIRREPYLVSYWRLNDQAGTTQALDASARNVFNGFYATPPTPGAALIQAPDSEAASMIGDGTQSVSVPDNPSLRVTGALSLEVWAFPSQAQSSLLIGKSNAGGTIAAPYALRLGNTGTVKFAVGNGSTEMSVSPIVALVGPTHIVGTFFRGTITLYVNGQKVISQSGSPSVSDAGQPLLIGGAFTGLLAETAFYNGALSALAIARRFAVGQQIIVDPAHFVTVDPPTYA